MALLVVNLDRFHQVNAGLGHKAGDLVLREAGRRLTAIVRGEDTVSSPLTMAVSRRPASRRTRSPALCPRPALT
ncbi:MAG: diguanylate cyclase [Ilumatobacteraceae bacterium]